FFRYRRKASDRLADAGRIAAIWNSDNATPHLFPNAMSTWNANAPTLSRLVGSGCLSCPDGSRVSGDDGLSALETLAKNIMVLNTPEFDGPKYPLSELPTKQAQSQLLGGDDYTI